MSLVRYQPQRVSAAVRPSECHPGHILFVTLNPYEAGGGNVPVECNTK